MSGGPGTVPEEYGEIVAEHEEGSSFDVEFYWNAPHGGWHQFRICADPTLMDLYTNTSYTPTLDDHDQMEACMAANPVTDWLWLGDSPGSSPPSTRVQLPQGVTCDHCFLGWRWDAWASGNEIYNQVSQCSVRAMVS
jgi:hypothetical protein